MESNLLLTYFMQPLDAYEVRVEDVACLAEPVGLKFRKRNGPSIRGHTTRVRGAAQQPLLVPFWENDPSDLLLLQPDKAMQGESNEGIVAALAADIDVDSSSPECDVDCGSSSGSRACAAAGDVAEPKLDQHPDVSPNVRAQLIAWGMGDLVADDLCAICLPEPICRLILANDWKHVLMLTRSSIISTKKSPLQIRSF